MAGIGVALAGKAPDNEFVYAYCVVVEAVVPTVYPQFFGTKLFFSAKGTAFIAVSLGQRPRDLSHTHNPALKARFNKGRCPSLVMMQRR